MRSGVGRLVGVAGWAVLVLGAWSCAVNPATGRRQLSLIGEGREIEMGRRADAEVERTVGLYAGGELEEYVRGVGMGLAAVSERPHLPWSFEVVDDPSVNAFALPGGFIYVTRGILAHLGSEAELAAVLGHEIGHVTARHAVEQISRAHLFGVGLGVGSLLLEPLRGVLGDVAGGAVGLLFLRYSRDHEREADGLGVRYAFREGHDPRAAIAVFEMLRRQAEEAGGGSLPGWLSTHPAPEDRIERIRSQLDTLDPAGLRGARVERARYLRRIDGLVFGKNPRNGLFRGPLFLHPAFGFQLRFPEGWEARNLARAVTALSPGRDAALELTLAEGSSGEAAGAFFSGEGVRARRVVRDEINGLPATVGRFVAASREGPLEGLAAFVELGGRTFRLLGYAPSGRWGRHEAAVRRSLYSFDRLRDPGVLKLQPMRIRLLTVERDVTLEELARSRGAPVPASRLAVLNGVAEGESIPAGTTIKWVVGEPPPEP